MGGVIARLHSLHPRALTSATFFGLPWNLERFTMSNAIEPVPLPIKGLQSKLAAFCQTHGIERLELFGSAARGDSRPVRDLDLLVTFRPGEHPGWDFFSLEEELEDILGCKVDLLTRRSVEQDQNSIRRDSILEVTREIYGA